MSRASIPYAPLGPLGRGLVCTLSLAAPFFSLYAHAQDGRPATPPLSPPVAPSASATPATATSASPASPASSASPAADPAVPATTPSTDTGRREPLPPDLLTFHRDNYFITGFTNATEVKAQFSAKFDIWPNLGHHALYLAYTQKELWALYRKSSPFTESNYNPELFYAYYHHDRQDTPPGCGLFKERAGVEHESDGEASPRSRGWNRFFLESRFACYSASHTFFSTTLQLWGPPFAKGDNADITHFLGYGLLALTIGRERGEGWPGNADLTLYARKGTSRDLGKGSLEIDGRWQPPYGPSFRFTPYLYAQIFTGYGESLLSYDHARTTARVGLGISDVVAHSP